MFGTVISPEGPYSSNDSTRAQRPRVFATLNPCVGISKIFHITGS